MLSHQILQLQDHINKVRRSPTKNNSQISLTQLETRLQKLQQQNKINEIYASKWKQYQSQLGLSKKDTENINQVVQLKAKQIDMWKSRCKKLEASLSDNANYSTSGYNGISQSRLRHAQQQKQRAQDEIKYKNSQIEEWKAKCMSLQRTINNYKVIQKQKRGLEQQLHYQIKISDDYQRKLHYLQDAASHLHELQNELKNQQSRRMEYIQQIQRLNGLIQIKSNQCQNLSRKALSLQQQIRSLKSVERELNQQKRKSQYINEQFNRINKIVSQKSIIILNLKQQFTKSGFNSAQKEQVKKLLDANMKQINDLFERLELANKHIEQLQIKLLQSNHQTSNLKNQIAMIKQQKQALDVMNYQKNQQCQNYKRQMVLKIDQIRQLRKFQSASYQYQVKIKNLEEGYNDIERRYKKQIFKYQDLYRLHSNAKSDIEKIKRDGYIPNDFLTEFAVLKKNYQGKQKQFKDLQKKLIFTQKALKGIKKALLKHNEMVIANNQKWLAVGKGINNFKQFTQKALEIHSKMGQVSQENISMQSTNRLMSFQLKRSSNILSKSFIQQSKSFTTQQSQKFSPSEANKLPIQRLTIGNTIKGNIIMRKSAIQPLGNYQYKSQYQSKLMNQTLK